MEMLTSEPLKSHRERIQRSDPKRAHHLAQLPVNFANDRCAGTGRLDWSCCNVANDEHLSRAQGNPAACD